MLEEGGGGVTRLKDRRRECWELARQVLRVYSVQCWGLALVNTRRYGPPLAEASFALWAKQRAFYAVLAPFGTFSVLSSKLRNIC